MLARCVLNAWSALGNFCVLINTALVPCSRFGIHSLQPHAQPIQRLALSSDAATLATISEDRSVFFLSLAKDSISPIGFVEVPSAINSAVWSMDGQKLLLATQEGSLYEFKAPKVCIGWFVI